MIPDELREFGATKEARELYPRATVRYGMTPRRGVFAVRYFNDQFEEVGYRIPSINNEIHVFHPPRVWAQEYLDDLEWIND